MSGIEEVPADRFEHGTRSRYVKGCRCTPCRTANTAYANARFRELKLGRAGRGDLVDATPARLHLVKLSRAGVGRRAAARAAGVAISVVFDVRSGAKEKIRRTTAEKILAITTDAKLGAALVDAKRTLKRLEQLQKLGLSKSAIARRLGSKGKQPALQIAGPYVTKRNALAVIELLDQVKAGIAAARAATRICAACDFSHEEGPRLEQLKGFTPEERAELPRTWPCLYGGERGARRLAEDLTKLA